MPESIKQQAFQLEAIQGSYGAFKFSHTFPMEKAFNYKSLKLPSGQNAYDVYVVKARQYIISVA